MSANEKKFDELAVAIVTLFATCGAIAALVGVYMLCMF